MEKLLWKTFASEVDTELDILPRCFNYKDNKNEVEYDGLKITFGIDKNDILQQKNILKGKIISQKLYPVIYDRITGTREMDLRSIPMLKKFIENPVLYVSLDDGDKTIFGTGLRDLFIAAERNMLTDDEISVFKKAINLVDGCTMNIYINGMEISPYPTALHKMVRYFRKEDFGENDYNQYFIEIYDGFMMAFIDPGDLSYHNFENILNFDYCFMNETIINTKMINIGLPVKILNKEIYIGKISCVEQPNKKSPLDILLEIDKMNLYTDPMNSLSRGGKRLIFKSNHLSIILTAAFRECGEKDIFENGEINSIFPDKFFKNFKFINYIFRYNKFTPGDKKFISHYDTPFYDADKKYCSKYTLIIYLTDGHANPTLKIDDTEINQIEKFTYVIFDQEYEHEGMAFIDTDKIFIRSELIYHDPNLEHNPAAAELFNIACYMTKETVFHDELQSYANRVFNQVAMIRQKIETLTKSLPRILMHRTYDNTIDFMTDGHNYWFPLLDLKFIAAIILVDYFNGKIMFGSDFRNLKNKQIRLEDTKEFNLDGYSKEEIYAFLLKKMQCRKLDAITNILSSELKNLSKFNIQKNFEMPKINNVTKKNYYCSPHTSGNIDEYKATVDTCNLYINKEKMNVTNTLKNYTVALFNKKIIVNSDNIKIIGNKILFDETGHVPGIHFAACGPVMDYDDIKNSVREIIKDFKLFKIPPITYMRDNLGYHLTIDMFNNDFIFPKEDKITLFKVGIELKLAQGYEIKKKIEVPNDDDYLSKFKDDYHDDDDYVSIFKDDYLDDDDIIGR